VVVDVEDESDSSHIDLEELRRWGEDVIAAEGFPMTTELSVFLVSETRIAQLNSSALGKAGATDVLSFPIEHLVPGVVPDSQGPPIVLGDVFLSPSYIRRQADELGVPEASELALMLTHGVLHCLGYDHVGEDDARQMEGRERELLAAWGMTRR
jgi:probable rRNA maturation factor